jgi:hypothetical protein
MNLFILTGENLKTFKISQQFAGNRPPGGYSGKKSKKYEYTKTEIPKIACVGTRGNCVRLRYAGSLIKNLSDIDCFQSGYLHRNTVWNCCSNCRAKGRSGLQWADLHRFFGRRDHASTQRGTAVQRLQTVRTAQHGGRPWIF